MRNAEKDDSFVKDGSPLRVSLFDDLEVAGIRSVAREILASLRILPIPIFMFAHDSRCSVNRDSVFASGTRHNR